MSSSPTPNRAKPVSSRQFTTVDLFYLVLLVGGFLALVMQLWHVGFAIFCFAAAVIVGYWRGKRQWLVAGVTGLLIFLIVYGVAWVQLGESRFLDFRSQRWVENGLSEYVNRLQEYQEEHGTYPRSLDQLKNSQVFQDRTVYWDHDFYYESDGSEYRLLSLGRDDELGGEGLDGDYELVDGRLVGPHRVTLHQFLFDLPASGAIFVCAFLTAFAGGYLCLGTYQFTSWGWKRLLLSYLATMTLAVLVATFLAAFYITISDNGH